MTDQQDTARPDGDDNQKLLKKEARKAARNKARQIGKMAARAAEAEVEAVLPQESSASPGGLLTFTDRIQQLRREMADLVSRYARSQDRHNLRLEQVSQQLEALLASRNFEYQRLRRKWAVPVTQPITLISQVPRSGGTLLARLFDDHPECFTHPLELRWGRPSKENWPSFRADPGMSAKEAYNLLTEKWAERFVSQGGYSKYPALIRDQQADDAVLYPFVYDSELAFDIFVEAYLREGTSTRRAVLNAYLTSVFNGWLDYQNLYAAPKRFVICFLPTIVTLRDSVERFFEDYSDGRLVTMVRHPGSWFASFASFSQHKGPVELSASMSLWLESTKASLDAAERYGDRVIVVLFDDLVLRTEATMRAVCARMGIGFDPVLLRPTYNGMPILSDSSFRLSATIDPETTRRHDTELNAEQRSEIDRIATPIYDELILRSGIERVV